jgi:hypothetical protein
MIMKTFYNRQTQLTQLRNNTANNSAIFDVIVGRRRVGKTRLIQEAFSAINNPYIYLFVSRKSEQALVDEFSQIIKNQLNTKFFSPQSLRDIFEYLLDYSTNNPITLVVEEFQDIERINASFYSDLQNLWDSYKQNSKMHLVVCGSLYNLMTKIFKGKDEPLFNRQDHYYHIKPLEPSYIKQIMTDNNAYSAKSFLLWWCLSGGIPKYLEWIVDSVEPLDTLLDDNSPLIKEGYHRLVEDFGEEHRTYFDILGAIASGYNTKPQIVSYLGYNINDAFPKLTDSFEIINKVSSMDAKSNSKSIRYEIADPFLRFWFRFIYKNRSAIEINNLDYIKNIIERDYSTHAGYELEYLTKEILIESKQFNRIGSFWDRKGHNEIDVIAINDANKTALFLEAKLQSKNYSEQSLLSKVAFAIEKLNLKGFNIKHGHISLENLHEVMAEYPPAN